MNDDKKIHQEFERPKKLIPLSRRIPFFYLERAMVKAKGKSLLYVTSEGTEILEGFIPAASLGGLILGPGTSISSKAARIASESGAAIFFSDGGGLPLRSVVMGARNGKMKLIQYEKAISIEERLFMAKMLMDARRAVVIKLIENGVSVTPPNSYSHAMSIEELMGVEGAWAKAFYKTLASELKTPWLSKRSLGDKNPLVFLNHLAYQLSDIAIFHLGLDRDIGILHGRTGGGGLTYDLADVWKPLLCTFPALISLSKKENNPGLLKSDFLSEVIKYDVIGEMVSLLETLFTTARKK